GGLAPEARRHGQEERREERGDRPEPVRAREAIEERARGGRRRRAEEAHAPRDGAEGQGERPELPEEHVERVPGRVRDAEQVDGRHQLAAVPDVDRRTRAEGVEDEEEPGDGGGFGLQDSAARSSSCTTCGFALPPVAFITWPTRKPRTCALPPFSCA